ncbi:MAG: FAD/NAD(P)-binding protein [Planctomycetes bacterium]|nr:FAD/NAD(P)-binding protein [Planctomycetota bacterium]
MTLTTKAETLRPVPYVLRDKWQETADTWSMALEPAEAWLQADRGEPGQFNMLWAFGVGESAISISGPTHGTGPLVHTIRACGNVTRKLCAMKAGEVVGLRGPYGKPWPIESLKGRDLIIMAGGIGLAPLRPVVYHILANREDFGRVSLLYGARRPEDILFANELSGWRGRMELDVLITVDAADSSWFGNVGTVTRLVRRNPFEVDGAAALVCGPEIMMQYSAQTLLDAGMNQDSIWVSMERNMKCGVGLCGHCQVGPEFVCKTGPVYPLERIANLLATREM